MFATAGPKLTPQPSGEQSLALSPDAVAALPEALRLELRDAVVTLDAKRISETIEKVAKHDAVLGSVLARHVERLAFSPILKAVDTVLKESTASND